MNRDSITVNHNLVSDYKITVKNIIFICIILLSGIYINNINHLLFHTGLEAFNITIAFCISIIALISKRIYRNSHFLLFGIAFMFIGLIDFLHALSYPGIGVFDSYSNADLSSQLFIAGRYIESTSLLIASLSFGKRIRARAFFFIYTISTVLMLLSIFYWRVFPVCFASGIGFTPFKIVSEYVVALVMVFSIVCLVYKQKELSRDMFYYLILSFSTSIIAEISFTLYTDIYDIPHILGNMMRLMSYYFIYKALVETSLLAPYKMVLMMNDELESNNSILIKTNEILKNEISERTKAEAALSQSEEKYRTLSESIPDAVLVFGGDRIIFVNKAGLKLVGAGSIAEVVGRYWNDFIHPDFRGTVAEKMAKCKAESDIVPLFEQKIVCLDGSIVDVESMGAYMTYQAEYVFIMAIRDITERKRAEILQKNVEENKKLLEEAAKYDKLKNEFMANISHELRTPLNIIFSAIQLTEFSIKDYSELRSDESVNKYFKVMKQNCYRLLRLVNNIIDITRMDSGFYELRLKNCDIVSLIEDITMSAVGFADNKGISLVFDTDFEEKVVACDPEKIERVMLNLLSNAVKFTPPGGNISVTLHDDGEQIIISVKDSGIGIPPDKLNSIFERFVQVDSSLAKSNEGSGIGLSLVKSIIEAHGGRITAHSVEGSGSEFIVELPEVILPSDTADGEWTGLERQEDMEKVNIEFSDV